jgi:hypothetical protein
MPLAKHQQIVPHACMSGIRQATLNMSHFTGYTRAKLHGEIMLKTEEYLIETADRCIRLKQEGRDLVTRLETIGNELMAKAVELDTTRQKTQKKPGSAGETSAS